MLKCSRIMYFDAAHRVIGHKNKCQFMHGHRYKVEAVFRSDELCKLGMVIDFGVIKNILDRWIEENWDHTTILNKKDTTIGESLTAITGQTIYYIDGNPTAENLAVHLLNKICPKLFQDMPIKCCEITIYETPNCYARSSDQEK